MTVHSGVVWGPTAASASASASTDSSTAPAEAPAHRGTYVIVYAESLKPAAEQWATYRAGKAGGGWSVIMHASNATGDLATQRAELQRLIRADYKLAQSTNHSLFAVLLLGDVSSQTAGDDFAGIPAWEFEQTDPVMRSSKDERYITDHPYQLMDDADELADIALGRVPARTLEEAFAVLEKIRRHESDIAPGPWRTRITYAAGEGRFGAIDNVLESLFKTMVDRMVPDAFDISMTYAKASSIYCPPPSQLTDVVLERLGEGAVLFNYIGHGFAKGFDSLHWNNKRLPILRVADLDRLRSKIENPKSEIENPQRPIAFLSCCSAGWFDLPRGEHSLAEAMLFHPAGPIAVIAGSRITHPYANTVLQKDITQALLVDRAETVGQLDLLATRSLLQIDAEDRQLDAIAAPIAFAGGWKTNLTDLRTMHARLYNLLGDPATRIALPAAGITMTIQPTGLGGQHSKVDAQTLENGASEIANVAHHQHVVSDLQTPTAGLRIVGRVDGMANGRVELQAQTKRTSMVAMNKIQPPTGDNDPQLEEKAMVNYPLVNDRTLATYEANVVDGRFELKLDHPLHDDVAVLRAYAVGADAAGQPMDAMGALRIRTQASSPGMQPATTAARAEN